MGNSFYLLLMVSSLFMMFDSSTYSSSGSWASWKWLLMLVSLSAISWNMFKLRSSVDLLYKWFSLELWRSLGKSSPLSFHLYVSCFILLMSFNLLGLVSFPLTAQPSINVSLAILMWFVGVYCSMSYSWKDWFSHFLPSGTPMFLWPLIVILEMVSYVIRPFTLAIRLTANIITGHILLEFMMSVLGYMLFPFSLIVSVTMFALFLLYEVFVCFLQAYIFTMLLMTYWESYESKELQRMNLY